MANNAELVRALLDAAKAAASESVRTGGGGGPTASYAEAAKTLVEAAAIASDVPEPGSIA